MGLSPFIATDRGDLIGRGFYLNSLISLYKPAKIVVEKLDLRSPKLFKRMSGLIQNFGKGYLKKKNSKGYMSFMELN